MKGMALETVGYIVLALIALAILFIVFSLFVPKVGDLIKQKLGELRDAICNAFLGNLNVGGVPCAGFNKLAGGK